jgi:nicotinamide riboside transporter PnuC
MMTDNPLIALNLDERSIISLMSFSVLRASLFSIAYKVLCDAKLQLFYFMTSILGNFLWKKVKKQKGQPLTWSA